MQTALFRIWTWVIVSISYVNNHYTASAATCIDVYNHKPVKIAHYSEIFTRVIYLKFSNQI